MRSSQDYIFSDLVKDVKKTRFSKFKRISTRLQSTVLIGVWQLKKYFFFIVKAFWVQNHVCLTNQFKITFAWGGGGGGVKYVCRLKFKSKNEKN